MGIDAITLERPAAPAANRHQRRVLQRQNRHAKRKRRDHDSVGDDAPENEVLDDDRRFVTLAEASVLSTLSEDSLRRHHRDKIVRLTPRRDGMRDALMLSRTK
jgi:hypothetical protein